MKSMRVLSVINKDDNIHLVKEVTNDDNSLDYVCVVMPMDILEWRSATYDLNDPDELIDFIMFEPHVDDPLPMQTDPDTAKTKMRNSISDMKLKMSNKPKATDVEAKNIMKQRGMDQIYIDGSTIDHYTSIKSLCFFDDIVIETMKEHVNKTRDDFNKQKNAPKHTPEERAAKIKSHFDVPHGDQVTAATKPEPQRNRTIFLGGKDNGKP